MQLYDITIAPNTTRQLDAPGSYFYYYSGNAGGADSTITMRGLSSGLRIVLKPGQAFRLPRGESETSWVLTNFSNTATILGTVIVGDGDITDNRITGSVEVIDGGKNRTLANQAFAGMCYVGPVAGQYALSQIWNPVGSGKNIFIEQISIALGSTGTADFGFSNTQLANLSSVATNKTSGGTGSTAQLRYSNAASTPAFSIVASFTTAANSTSQLYKFTEPLLIKPGYGLNVNTYTIGQATWFNSEFFEESI